MSAADPIVIVGAARTPMGAFQSDFASLSAHDLGGAAIAAAVQRAGVPPDQVDEVLFGNCLMAGQGQAPARQAAFKGGLPKGRLRRVRLRSRQEYLFPPAQPPSTRCAARA